MSTTSPYRTTSDLVLAVLKRARVLAVGQAVDVDDYNNIAGEIDSIIRKIAGLEIVYIADANNIPGAFFSDLVDIVIGECATTLGLSGQEYVEAVNKGLGGAGGMKPGDGAAAQSLKVIARGRPTYEPLQIMNF
ncbi:hypothetical protein ACRAVF_27260 [Bradyrhizobium oligotrophicum S58]